VLNSSDGAMQFNIGWRGQFAHYKLGGGDAVTFVWKDIAEK
jgi:hypothetical protein